MDPGTGFVVVSVAFARDLKADFAPYEGTSASLLRGDLIVGACVDGPVNAVIDEISLADVGLGGGVYGWCEQRSWANRTRSGLTGCAEGMTPVTPLTRVHVLNRAKGIYSGLVSFLLVRFRL